MNQQSSSMIRLHQLELMILIQRSEGGEIRQNSNLVQDPARKHNPVREPSHRAFDGGYKIMSRCLTFGSPVASRYAQFNSISYE
jgi:hypothetical protein